MSDISGIQYNEPTGNTSTNMIEQFDKMAEMNEFFGLPYDEHTDELIKSFIRTIRQNDKKELIKIADAGEYENLRREVVKYFK